MNKRKKLIWQIFPSFLLITLLSLFAVSWYASQSLRQFYLDHTATDLYARTQLLEKRVGRSVNRASVQLGLGEGSDAMSLVSSRAELSDIPGISPAINQLT